MASIKIGYASSEDVACTLASLASSTTWVGGQQSDAVDNSANKYLDFLLSGEITVGTTPTSNTEIRVYLVAALDDVPTWPDVFDGTDSAKTVTSIGVRDSFVRLPAILFVDSATSNRTYSFGPISVASMFGGIAPARFSVFVAHNTGVALNATGSNHFIKVTPVYQDIVA